MVVEYKVVRFLAYETFEEQLNALGAEGWMLVHCEDENPGSGALVIFMRQVFNRPTSPEEYFG